MRAIPDTIDASCGEELRAQLRRGVPGDVKDHFPYWATSYATGSRPGVDAQGCGPGMWLNVQLVQRAVAAGLQVPMTGMLFATGDWKAYMLRLKKKDCKMMGQTPAVTLVVLLTKALFRSGPCLDEIAVARANKMTVILLRCEDDLPGEDDMWSLPDKLKEAGAMDQIQAYMLKRGDVVEWMGSENSIPTPGNTILSLPSAFDTFLGELRAATPAAAWAEEDHTASAGDPILVREKHDVEEELMAQGGGGAAVAPAVPRQPPQSSTALAAKRDAENAELGQQLAAALAKLASKGGNQQFHEEVTKDVGLSDASNDADRAHDKHYKTGKEHALQAWKASEGGSSAEASSHLQKAMDCFQSALASPDGLSLQRRKVAKICLAYTSFRLGEFRLVTLTLDVVEAEQAKACFQASLKLLSLSDAHSSTARQYLAFACYAEAKAHLACGNIAKAQELFRTTKLTHGGNLPEAVNVRLDKYCKADVDGMKEAFADLKLWFMHKPLSFKKADAAKYACVFADEGYDTPQELYEDVHDETLTQDVLVEKPYSMKPRQAKKMVDNLSKEGVRWWGAMETRALDSGDFQEGNSLYHDGVREGQDYNLDAAADLLQQAIEAGLDEGRAQRASDYIRAIKEAKATFDPEVTQNAFQISKTAAGMATRNLFDSAMTLSIKENAPNSTALCLDMNFADVNSSPESESDFKSSVLEDVAKALGLPRERFKVTQLTEGSVIVHLDIVEGEQQQPSSKEVLELLCSQIADATSEIYSGTVTKMLNGVKTQQLAEGHAAVAPARLVDGQEVTLWEQGGQSVGFKVVRHLGAGAQAEIKEVDSDGETRALKVGPFGALCDEAAILMKINFPESHPHVVNINFVFAPDSGELQGQLCFLEECIDGGDLGEVMNAHPEQAARLGGAGGR